MKLYATIENERGGIASKSGDDFLEIVLSAFGKRIGRIVLATNTDANDKQAQYIVKYAPRNDDMEWAIIEEGHKTEGVIQRMK